MECSLKAIRDQALELSEKDRAILVEHLLKSLNLSDSVTDGLWATESENRVDDYETGKIQTKSAQDVFGKYNDFD